jgi:uncharacterized Zn finger protein
MDREPRGMTCEICGLEWFSRLATLIVAQEHLARCASCGGVLRLTESVTRPQLREPPAAADGSAA